MKFVADLSWALCVWKSFVTNRKTNLKKKAWFRVMRVGVGSVNL